MIADAQPAASWRRQARFRNVIPPSNISFSGAPKETVQSATGVASYIIVGKTAWNASDKTGQISNQSRPWALHPLSGFFRTPQAGFVSVELGWPLVFPCFSKWDSDNCPSGFDFVGAGKQAGVALHGIEQ